MKNGRTDGSWRGATQSNWFLLLATAVLLLAAVMRLTFLHDVPPGLSQDEVLNADIVTFIRQGYHALFFREGYGHEPLYHYWSVPFQVLLGDNVLSIRLPAAYLGIFLVAGSMRWARREYGPVAALAAGAGLAAGWWPVIFSRIGLRPILEPVLLLLFAWFWPRRPWLAGLFLGLSVYSYTGARIMLLWPVLLCFYWLLLADRGAARWRTLLGRRIPQPAAAAVATLILALLLYLPLAWTLRNDPSLQQRVEQLQGPLEALFRGDWRPATGSTLATLGVFTFGGDPRWTYSLPGRPFFDPLTGLFFYGGLVVALLRLRQPAYAFVLMWLLLGLIPSAVTPQAPSTVRLVGAMPAVYVLPGIALAWAWGRWVRPHAPASRGQPGRGHAGGVLYAAAAALLLLLVLTMARTVADGFVRWPSSLETRLKYQTVLLDISRDLERHSRGAIVIADGFYRPITADSLKRLTADERAARWVQTGSDFGGALVLPHEGDGVLYVPEFAPPHYLLLQATGADSEPLYRSGGKPSFAVYKLPATGNWPITGEEITFGDVLTLVGYDIVLGEDEKSLQLLTAWRVEEALPEDLSFYVHWLDGAGNLLSQYDGFDAAPGTLQPGDVVVQRHVLPYPDSLTPDTALHLGLYMRGSGDRLLRSDEQAGARDHLVLPLEDLLEERSG